MVEVGAALALIIMALVTYSTRISGAVVMSFVPLSPGVKRFLAAISGSVLVAIIVPPAVHGDMAAQGAVISAIGMMVLKRNTVLAMSVGVLVAILIRAAGL